VSDSNSPVHTLSAAATRWSRVNFAEAIQGVQTPLGWTFWEYVMERAVRRAFGAIGAFSRAEVAPPDSADLKTCGVFFGQATGNVTMFHRIGEAMVGTTGDAVIEQMFGERRGPVAGSGRRAGGAVLRYPVIAVKMPTAAIRSARRIRGVRDECRRWWRAAVVEDPPATLAEATGLLRDSAERFIEVGIAHTVISMVGQALVEQVEGLAGKAWGSGDQAADLLTGLGGLEEADLIGDVWSVAHGGLDLEEFLARHGYHGPDEGSLTSVVWREDPTPARRLVQRYRSSDVDHPRAREPEQVRRREAAEARLLGSLGRPDRVRARVVLRLARSFVPMRELGKAGFLHSLDGARCAARAIGTHLVKEGLIGDAEDVFFLTYQELLDGVRTPVHDTVAERRDDNTRFERLTVPYAWTGNPVPLDPAAADTVEPVTGEPVDRLEGIGAGGDEVTGRARVILDPSEADLEPGEILVCRTTDPSWTPLFLVADALVIDTGGLFSHGAIVARELGITCVINIKSGTRDIPDGATVTVNGRTGVVHIARPGEMPG
jgi:phosphohistidine swiveling domain-containing protein